MASGGNVNSSNVCPASSASCGILDSLAKFMTRRASLEVLMTALAAHEFSVDKVLIVGRYRRFPSVGLLMEASEDDEFHNNLVLTSCILSADV